MRLNRYLAQAGVASRRKSEELIVAGKVRINGAVVRDLATTVSGADDVKVNGKAVHATDALVYLVLNKPEGCVTTMRDPQGRRTVAELIPRDLPRVVPVGRLDYHTSGVLLLTNDGALANRATHPRYGVEKTYRAILAGRISPEAVAALHGGVDIGDGVTESAKVRVVRTTRNRSEVDITIHEGRNRQVRRMFEAVGFPVEHLIRMRFGPISLGDLPLGSTRAVSERELNALRRETDGDA